MSAENAVAGTELSLFERAAGNILAARTMLLLSF